jgi:hypothetical protein
MIHVQIKQVTVYRKYYTPEALATLCGVKGSEAQIADWVESTTPEVVEDDMQSTSDITDSMWLATVIEGDHQ